MMLDRIDEYIILLFGVWFIGLAILFATTYYVSRTLMKGKVRTRLSAAQHTLFFGLAVVGSAMGPTFILRYFSGTGLSTPRPHIEPYWITVGLRVALLTGFVIVSVAGTKSFVAQYKRYHGIEDDLNDMALEQTNARQDDREVEQNVREVFQDERTAGQDRLTSDQNERATSQNQRDVRQDNRTAGQDRRDVTACARDVIADERDAKENT